MFILQIQVLKSALGALHLIDLVEGSVPAQGTAKESGLARGIAGSTGPAHALEIAAGTGHAQRIAVGTTHAEGIAAWTVHAQGIAGAIRHMKEILVEAAEIGPGHQPLMGTAKLASEHFLGISLW